MAITYSPIESCFSIVVFYIDVYTRSAQKQT